MSRIKQHLPEDIDVLDGVNQILIYEPRWHDRVVLVAERRILPENQVVIQHHEFPRSFFITGEEARKYPLEQMETKAGGTIAVRAIPLSELEKETI